MSKIIPIEIKNQVIEYAKQGLSAYKVSILINHHNQTVANIFRENGFEVKKQGFQPIYPINHNFFSDLTKENSAYYAGLLAADGWLTSRNAIGITLKETDKNILTTLSENLSPNKPIIINTTAAKTVKFQERNINRSSQCRLSWTSKQMTLDLNAIGIGKNKSLIMGKVVSNIPEVSRHHFIRGYLDGDGYVCNYMKNKLKNENGLRVGLCGTEHFLKDLRYCLNATLNINVGYIHKSNNSPIYYLDYNGKKTCFLIKDYLYGDASIFMRRKLDKFIWLV